MSNQQRFVRYSFGWLALHLLAVQFVNVASAATLTVTSVADDGAGSLRRSITDANAGDTIAFALTGAATITLTSGELTIGKDLTIDGSNAAGNGSAVTISGNHVSRAFFVTYNTTANLRNLRVSDCRVTSGSGGAIFAQNFAKVTMQNVALANNAVSGHGGALYLDYGATASMDRVILSANSAEVDGGGVFCGGDVRIVDCAIKGNSAGRFGGGLYSAAGGLNVVSTTINGNSTVYNGGGVCAYGASSSMVCTTITGNTAGLDGGGVAVNGHTTFLVGATVWGNSAARSGGGCYLASGGSLLNSIVVGNGAPAAADLYSVGSEVCASWYAGRDGTIEIVPAAPNLERAYEQADLFALGNYGGVTQTIALAERSPAIGLGLAAYYNAGVGFYFLGLDGRYYRLADLEVFAPGDPTADQIITDQRGVSRGSPFSAGAFQLAQVASVGAPPPGIYYGGDTLTFRLRFNAPVTVSTVNGTPRLALNIGGRTQWATYRSGSGTDELSFAYHVLITDGDADGIAIGEVSTAGGSITDSVGYTAAFTLPAVDCSGIVIGALDLEADPDGDGFTNFEEYAYGLDPLVKNAASAAPQVALAGYGDGSALTATFTKNLLATDVALVVEVSEDLVTWTSGDAATQTVSTTDLGSNVSRLVVRDLATANSSVRRFLRVRVTK
jgi:hypothetical protein